MQTNPKRYHQKLSEYFLAKPLWFQEEKQEKPNTRKLVEQPWQQTQGEMVKVEETLCDFGFIEAKCIAGMLFRLFGDYDHVVNQNYLNHQALLSINQMRKALNMALPALMERPSLTIQSIFNRISWFDGLSPLISLALKKTRDILTKRSAWMYAEASLPHLNDSSHLKLSKIDSWIQSFSGNRLAVGSNMVEVFDILTGQVVDEFHNVFVNNNLCAIAIAEDGKSLAYMDIEGKVESLKTAAPFNARIGEHLLIFHTTHGVLTVRNDNALVCWNPITGESSVLAQNLPKPLIVLRSSLNGDVVLFVAGHQNQTIGICSWDGKVWGYRKIENALHPILDASIDLSAKWILIASIDRQLSILDMNGYRLAQLSYEQTTDILGAPVKCVLGFGPSQEFAFLATSTGQVLSWNWKENVVIQYEPYRSFKESNPLVLMEVIPYSGELFLTTFRSGKILSPISNSNNHDKLMEPISTCILTNNGIVVSIEKGLSIRWSTFEKLYPLDVHVQQFPSALAPGNSSESVWVGNEDGQVWEINLRLKDQKRVLFHLGEPVVSMFYQEIEPSIIVAGKHASVIRQSTISSVGEVLWHSTGWQQQIKIQSAGEHGLFWSLRFDESSGTVVSLVYAVDREKIAPTKGNVYDISATSNGAMIAVAGENVQILRLIDNEWNCKFQRAQRVIRLNRICFLNNDTLLAVLLDDEQWLEVWSLAPGLPTIASVDLPEKVNCIHAIDNHIVLGCQSGNHMAFSLQSILF